MNKEGGLVWSRWWKRHPEGTKKTSPWGYTAVALWPITGPKEWGSPSSLLSSFWYLDILPPVFVIVTLRSSGFFYPQPFPLHLLLLLSHNTCHLTHSYPSIQIQLLLPHNILFLDLPEYESSNYLWNVDNCLPSYMVSHPRRLQSFVLDCILNKYLL